MNNRIFALKKPNGLTVLEVLFSMGIILVGLVGIAAMIPFAGRQAAESYKIAHGLASGSNALAAFQSDHFILPRSDRPWQLVDDEYTKGSPSSGVTTLAGGQWALSAPFGATNQTFFPSLERLYDGNRAKQPSLYRYHLDKILGAGELSGNVKAQIALAQNRALGQAFCIDPLFYAEQFDVPNLSVSDAKIARGAWGNLRRSRFPFYDESYPVSLNPFDASGTKFQTPRFIRTSFRDGTIPISGASVTGAAAGIWMDRSWLRGDAAKMTSTMESRDLVADRSPDGSLTYRQFNAVETGSDFTAVIKGVESGSLISWLATVTPVDSTPIVNPLSIEFPSPAGLPGMDYFPESYEVSVAVFGRRDVTELATDTLKANNYAGFQSSMIVPQSERLAQVTQLSDDSASSGTFEVVLSSYNYTGGDAVAEDPRSVSAKVKQGDWIILSRYVYNNPFTADFAVREMHKWYRVVGVTGPEVFPRRVRVAGAPWDWSVHELNEMKRRAKLGESITVPVKVDPSVIPTVATLLSDVVTVYQRNMVVGRQ